MTEAYSTLKYNDIKGTHIENPPQNLRQRIEAKVKSSTEENLGADARKYLEHILKRIASALEVKMAFRFNDANEDRMAFELLTELKGELKRRKCDEIKENPLFDRLMGSTFIGNKDSHDASYVPKFSDMKAFWEDVAAFEKLFYCDKCASYISCKHYDSVQKKVCCKDAALTYSWHP